MRHGRDTFVIRVVTSIIAAAFILYGCTATRVMKNEIVRGKLETTQVEKRYTDQKINLQEISPLLIKATQLDETKEIRKNYYQKISRVETMKTEETFGEIFANLVMTVGSLGFNLLFWIPVGPQEARNAINRCPPDGGKIKGDGFLRGSYTCTKSISEQPVGGIDRYEVVQEEVLVDKRENPVIQKPLSVTVNDRFKTTIPFDSDGTATLRLYEFPELAKSGQGAKIEYRCGNASLATQVPGDEVQRIFASLTPAHLSIKPTVRLEDGLSTGILRGDERGSVVLEVVNDGKGPAFGVKLITTGSYPGLSYESPREIGDMKPGEIRGIRIPVTASPDVKEGKIELSFQAKEQMGRDSLPLRLRPAIIIKELDKPEFVLASLDWTDYGGYASGNGNNIPENNETVEIKVKVQNIGKGLGKGVSLKLKDLPGLKLVVPEADLGNIPPGGVKEGRLAVHFPKLYKPNEKNIPMTVTASDSRPIGVSAGKAFKLPYQYNEPGLKLVRVEIFDGDPNTNSRGNMNHLIDQDEEVEIRLRLENEGSLQAEGVSIALSTSKQNVRVTPAKLDLGTLPAGEKKRFASFTVEVPASVSPGPITFNIDIKQKDYPPVTEKRDYTVMEASTVGTAAVKVPGALPRGGVSLPVPENIDEVPYLAEHRKENAYAVVIGIGNYKKKDVSAVPYAKADAETARIYLENLGGFAKENVQTLIEADATLTEMRRHLKDWLKSRVDRNSLVVVFFSGHGVPELDQKAPYLLPYDGDPNAPRSTAYALSELKADLNALPTKHVVIMLDACYSGQGRSAPPTGVKGVLWVEDDSTPTEAVMISASRADQTAWDYPEKSHGLFTYFLLKGMRGQGVDANGDGYVDTDELFRYLKSEVEAVSRRISSVLQSPVMIGDGKGIKLTRSLQ